MTISNAAVPVVDRHVYLLGRPPIGEFLGYVRTCGLEANGGDEKELMEEWRTANDRVRELETSEGGLADDPPMEPLPPELHEAAEAVVADRSFQQAFRLLPTELVMVELDRLVVYQKYINLTHVDELRRDFPSGTPTMQELFRICIPEHSKTPPVRITRTAANSYTFVSPSRDFRFIEPTLLDADQVVGYSRMGPVTAVVGSVLGFGWNSVNALQVENRLILNNGSHRAFALRDLGVTHVPCVVQKVTRPEELEIASGEELRRHSDRYLRSPRPALLKDYFDDRLRKVLDVARVHRMVKVTIGVEMSDIPA